MSDNKEFFDLLNSISAAETFNLTLTDKKDYTFKQLFTSQLRDLIETVVDSPITQSEFNNTVANVMKDSLASPCGIFFNIIDRLLFVLETRIQSISPLITVNEQQVDLSFIKQALVTALEANSSLFEVQSLSSASISITYGIPLIATETQLNDEYYKNVELNVETQEDLRKIIGETFINEIAKTLYTITVNDKILDLTTVSFKERIKTIESLPASLINNVIQYVEKYRKVVEESLKTTENTPIPIDGTLFSLR
jgi:hypothetical protein